jgi:hypothetical protein
MYYKHGGQVDHERKLCQAAQYGHGLELAVDWVKAAGDERKPKSQLQQEHPETMNTIRNLLAEEGGELYNSGSADFKVYGTSLQGYWALAQMPEMARVEAVGLTGVKEATGQKVLALL